MSVTYSLLGKEFLDVTPKALSMKEMQAQRIPLHGHRMTTIQETGSTKCQRQYEKLECSHMVGENVNCYTHFGKNLAVS